MCLRGTSLKSGNSLKKICVNYVRTMEYSNLQKEISAYLQKRYSQETIDDELLSVCCEMYKMGINDEYGVNAVKKKAKLPPSWRRDKELYLKGLNDAFEAVKANKAWVARQSSYYKDVDVIKTIERSICDYWATDLGWRNKRSKRLGKIDWQQTFANILKSRYNHVPVLANDMAYDDKAISAFVEAYAEICHMLPQPSEITDMQRHQIMLCISQLGTMDRVRELFEKVANSDFLTGRVKGKTDWIASIDWIIKDKFVCNKIMQGKYDNIKKDINTFTIAREDKAEKSVVDKKDF